MILRTAVGGFLSFLAAGIVVAMSLLLLFGVKNSSRFNLGITILNVAIILFVIMYASFRASNRHPIIIRAFVSQLRSLGATEVDTNNWDPFFPYGFEGSFQGAGTVFFSFIGTPHSPHARARTHRTRTRHRTHCRGELR